MDAPVVIFDACVLYPAPLRDVLLELSTEGIFLARWTDDIHDEWISNLLENAGGRITPQTLDRTRQLMNKAVPDCLVTGYQPLIESLRLPDKDDRHCPCRRHRRQGEHHHHDKSTRLPKRCSRTLRHRPAAS